jgi:hypothetical protein
MMINFVKRSEICCYKMSFGYVVGEMKEVWEEVVKFDVGGVCSEMLDVYSCGMVWLSDVLGMDLYVVDNKNVRGWKERWDWWKVWLGDKGYEFKAEYMRYGANYNRKEKRDRVLKMAEADRYDGLW